VPASDDNNILHGCGDDGRHVGLQNHVTRQYHEQAARSDESSCGDDDVDSEIDLDVTGSDMA